MKHKIISTSYYYMRGVAPHEASEAWYGRNGQVDTRDAKTNRGDHLRLAFAMNELGQSGIDWSVVDDFIRDASYYANLGAAIENNPKAEHPEVLRHLRGFLLVYRAETPLPQNAYQKAVYGSSWRTTSILPDGIEKNLIGVTVSPYTFDIFDDNNRQKIDTGSYSVLGPAHPVLRAQQRPHSEPLSLSETIQAHLSRR